MHEFTKIIHGSGTTPLIISNEEMNDIMKIVQALEGTNVLLKGVTKKRKRNCKSWYWSSLVVCFAETMRFLMPPHPLTNFEIKKH